MTKLRLADWERLPTVSIATAVRTEVLVSDGISVGEIEMIQEPYSSVITVRVNCSHWISIELPTSLLPVNIKPLTLSAALMYVPEGRLKTGANGATESISISWVKRPEPLPKLSKAWIVSTVGPFPAAALDRIRSSWSGENWAIQLPEPARAELTSPCKLSVKLEPISAEPLTINVLSRSAALSLISRSLSIGIDGPIVSTNTKSLLILDRLPWESVAEASIRVLEPSAGTSSAE